ncbi:MAG: hypothetical protein WC849_03200 [Candidatus Paceibacterota bacterium]
MFDKRPQEKKEDLFEEKEKVPMNSQDLIKELIEAEESRKRMFKKGIITEYGEKPPVIQVNGKVVLRIEMRGDIINIVSE